MNEKALNANRDCRFSVIAKLEQIQTFISQNAERSCSVDRLGWERVRTHPQRSHCVVYLCKTHYPLQITDSNQEDRNSSRHDWKIVDVKHQNKLTLNTKPYVPENNRTRSADLEQSAVTWLGGTKLKPTSEIFTLDYDLVPQETTFLHTG